jgi:hypothetical protein
MNEALDQLAQGGAAAVADRVAFAPEFEWQCATLTALAAAPQSSPWPAN